MKHLSLGTALAAALLALPLSAPASAQDIRPAGNSAPVEQQLADQTPLPSDTAWPGGTISLDIDATDTVRGIYRVTETIPVTGGMRELHLLFPEWLPGNHAARGPINLVSGFQFTSGGKTLEWTRNPLDVYEIIVSVPQGAKNVVANFVHTSPVDGSEGRITMTPEMLNLQWEKMSFYPAGHYTRRIAIKPTVKFPAGWTAFTALDGQRRSGDTVTWQTVDYETLVDSPIFAGKYAKQWQLDPAVKLDAIADKPKYLDLAPENLAHFEKLIDEADALFGARHFDHYDILLAMTDTMGGIGLEHHRSAENQYEPTALTDWDAMDWDHNVVSHELVHSWNGKFRRPSDLWTPDYRTPMQDTLLWVYEGQTQFWGWVLAARSGLQKKQTFLDAFATYAANYAEGQPGRAYRSVEDTTHDPIINSRAPLPYSSLSRSEDYYVEGALVWLEADQIIREGTNGAKGLDDFAKAFFGVRDGDWGELPYDFDEVVSTLNGVYPYDWANFLTTRLYGVNQPAPLRGLNMAGYKLVWKEEPNSYDKGRMGGYNYTSLTYSLGVNLTDNGTVSSTLWDGPAFDAGLVDGSQILAVNGTAYSKEAIMDAITAAKGTKDPIELMVKRGDAYRTVKIDYHDGLRYPYLEKTGEGEHGLDRLLAPRTGG
ncbi:peptidase M61 [Erythrobacter sp. LQ02-29]|uniref:M61 family metallopeptidase n=1 Tax=Erythrobacter sp. LQ02-29 TaxID=2920384 RepID=UPI001F4EFE00|nr:peptidase M61 [Erythrobacter sp. LQ02-29]MCP9221545.1 peptidase M61 [Erythrobacter sp. LQ02-29]